ncbi:MAG: aminodeoxychorismate synthase, component I, partial [FCB group bacterium]|nr:aminodeoxychorismate synthase, component I [FCB group bacterium]
MITPPKTGIARFVSRHAERLFRDPVEIISARILAEVLPALRRIEAAVETGLHAAGYLAYEAAPAFDPALSAHAPLGYPL